MLAQQTRAFKSTERGAGLHEKTQGTSSQGSNWRVKSQHTDFSSRPLQSYGCSLTFNAHRTGFRPRRKGKQGWDRSRCQVCSLLLACVTPSVSHQAELGHMYVCMCMCVQICVHMHIYMHTPTEIHFFLSLLIENLEFHSNTTEFILVFFPSISVTLYPRETLFPLPLIQLFIFSIHHYLNNFPSHQSIASWLALGPAFPSILLKQLQPCELLPQLPGLCWMTLIGVGNKRP